MTQNEAIFVDDRLKNVDGARQVGMHASRLTERHLAIRDILNLIKEHDHPFDASNPI